MAIELKLLLLLVVANGAPILARHLFKDHFNWPLDGGLVTASGRHLLGPSKTIRGLIASLVITAMVAQLIGIDWPLGMMIAAFAMLGDLCASFIKRRIDLPPSSQAVGLDQIPESLVPLIPCAVVFDLHWWSVLYLVLAFWVVVVLLSRLLYLLGVRRRPY
ncbi:MAG: CDP-archaeol synthase [gamma proteobacterium symbiont of Ctena orbiculata]|nr:CDP-archaeol synthase [Candidatus Thiodiazotropha taylori]MBT3059215.1 CDP-archaeol synthase [Candidatus Thiodiazotropha sp. (ex Lucina pensylvanica)]MBV2094163.1 CDP-archaeol synthase [Candidatus Thiodiazotropha sp. (ex Codakia orbicularis)]PUB71975.1 MAG: CDP-archaeol synthase [gamma proteobacterium symbiont of Ctena orbiculata]MBT3061616.1 CDP-archaeol synthase [Candidatus Thiodiazotropha sp. (ex Lucina pensylvanica)]